MIRMDPESSLKSDISVRGDIDLECCADSCAAVARLLRYVSADGDFQSEFESSSGNTTTSSGNVSQTETRESVETEATTGRFGICSNVFQYFLIMIF